MASEHTYGQDFHQSNTKTNLLNYRDKLDFKIIIS